MCRDGAGASRRNRHGQDRRNAKNKPLRREWGGRRQTIRDKRDRIVAFEQTASGVGGPEWVEGDEYRVQRTEYGVAAIEREDPEPVGWRRARYR